MFIQFLEQKLLLFQRSKFWSSTYTAATMLVGLNEDLGRTRLRGVDQGFSSFRAKVWESGDVKSLSSVESVTPGTIYWLDSFRCIQEMLETRDKCCYSAQNQSISGNCVYCPQFSSWKLNRYRAKSIPDVVGHLILVYMDMVQLVVCVKLKPFSKMAHSTEICSCREYRLFREVALLSEIFF
jgi:hypothetical protein